jgi:hypothetical protein
VELTVEEAAAVERLVGMGFPKNKVLEAYAMARNVVMTGAAANGLLPADFIAACTHDEPAAMGAAVAQALLRAAGCPPAPPRESPARKGRVGWTKLEALDTWRWP